MTKNYSIIGLMSGTSMDGLDVTFCTFYSSIENQWSYEIHHAKTYEYPSEIVDQLSHSKSLNSIELIKLDQRLGEFYGKKVNQFIGEYSIDRGKIDAIASHGHTVFHQPKEKITLQIGCGRSLSNECGLDVINDFRKQDVLHGGQGAPLVPIGDKYLFSKEAESFLNIGGFSNITLIKKDIRAFDICPGNLPLNMIAEKLGKKYDKNGSIARTGNISNAVLSNLNDLDFYNKIGPKSLGTEWLENTFLPQIDPQLDHKDQLTTITEHIAIQIAKVLSANKIGSVYITGGGAKNDFLIERIKAHFLGKVIIPNPTIVDFKEAIVFAFLGVLFLENQPNCLSSVTGASHDVKGGTLYPSK